MKLPRDAVLNLDTRLTVKVDGADMTAPARITIQPTRKRGRGALALAAFGLAFAGGLVARDVAAYAFAGGTRDWAAEQAALEAGGPIPRAVEPPRRAPSAVEPGSAPQPARPPATVVRPEGGAAPAAPDPFRLTQ